MDVVVVVGERRCGLEFDHEDDLLESVSGGLPGRFVTERVRTGREPPRVGDEIEGSLWLQGRLGTSLWPGFGSRVNSRRERECQVLTAG